MRNTKHQKPNTKKHSTIKYPSTWKVDGKAVEMLSKVNRALWSFKLGVYLVFGVWILVF
jgi:hypothetical protein